MFGPSAAGIWKTTEPPWKTVLTIIGGRPFIAEPWFRKDEFVGWKVGDTTFERLRIWADIHLEEGIRFLHDQRAKR